MRRLIASTIVACALGGTVMVTASSAGAVEITPARPYCTMQARNEANARQEAAYWRAKAAGTSDPALKLAYQGRAASAIVDAVDYHQNYVDAGC